MANTNLHSSSGWRRGLSRFHRDEGGAILMLALVGAMILILIANTLYDAGRAAHEKTNIQAAADVAAYSQASIKARSMNMMAYSNVAKRSIWGIHSTYPAYLKSMHTWVTESLRISCNACTSSGNLCNKCWLARSERLRWIQNVCEDHEDLGCDDDDETTWGNFRSLAGREFMGMQWKGGKEGLETEEDWPQLPSSYVHAGVRDPNDPLKSLFRIYHAQDILALDNYQRYLFGITPWWGWTEQLLKALRAGATVSGSWPMPAGRTPAMANQLVERVQDGFNQAAIAGGAAPSYADGMGSNYSLYADALPVYPGELKSMKGAIKRAIDFGALKSCARDYLQRLFSGSPNSSACQNVDPFAVEHLLNAAIMTLKSRGMVRGEYANLLPETLLTHAMALDDNSSRGYGFGLDYTQRSFARILEDDRMAAEPWRLRRFHSPGMWQINNSNLVMTYAQRFGVFDEQRDRKKYGFMGDYQGNSLEDIQRRLHFYDVHGLPGSATMQELTYQSSGYWGMARSEVYFADDDDPPDLWHPSWSARMRPVSLPREFEQGQYTMNQIYHDITKSIAVGTVLGVSTVNDLTTAIYDLMQNEKVTSAMGPSTVEGVAK